MGMSTGKKGNLQSEINVTPLIDVLLVLLIIFLVMMPIMMKKETLTIPRTKDEGEVPPAGTVFLAVKVQSDGTIAYNEGRGDDVIIQQVELAARLRPSIMSIRAGLDKVVFVDFQDGVPWKTVVKTMDTIRSLATDADKEEIKVALTICDRRDPDGKGCPKPQ